MTTEPLTISVQPKDLAAALEILDQPAPGPLYVLHYRLHGTMGATTPEPAEGAMRDRGVLLGMGAEDVRVVEVKR